MLNSSLTASRPPNRQPDARAKITQPAYWPTLELLVQNGGDGTYVNVGELCIQKQYSHMNAVPPSRPLSLARSKICLVQRETGRTAVDCLQPCKHVMVQLSEPVFAFVCVRFKNI